MKGFFGVGRCCTVGNGPPPLVANTNFSVSVVVLTVQFSLSLNFTSFTPVLEEKKSSQDTYGKDLLIKGHHYLDIVE